MVKRENQKCSAIFYRSPKQCNFVHSASRLPRTIDVLDMANGFQIWSTEAGHKEAAGGFEPIRLRNILNEY